MKYYKTINNKGKYPTRLVIPVTKLTVTLSKLVHLWIEKKLDTMKVNYSRFIIVQTYYMKEKLEDIGVNRDKVMIASIYTVNM